MAQKRMFSKIITNSEEFLEMPESSQTLYFHLNMNADDDGFVQPKRIMRMIGVMNEDNLKVLIAKGFLIPVADKVIVIKHWHINNTIRKDRYSPSIFKEHLKELGLDDSGIYKGKPNVNQSAPQISIVKISKEEKSKDEIHHSSLLTFWNENIIGVIPKIRSLPGSRETKYKLRISEGMVLEKIFDHMKKSKFLQGENNRNWHMTFDWLIENSINWVKIMEGNYDDKQNNEKVDIQEILVRRRKNEKVL